VGGEMLIVNRVLTDRHGNQRGTFVLRGTLVQVFLPSDALMAFQATNTITGEGLINTQGVIRFSDIPMV
jgi:hypothetical protein